MKGKDKNKDRKANEDNSDDIKPLSLSDVSNLSDAESILKNKEEIFLQMWDKAIDFLNTPHDSGDVDAFQKKIRMEMKDLLVVYKALNIAKDTYKDFEEDREIELRKKANELRNCIKGLASWLGDDKRDLQQKEAMGSIDLIKNFTFIAGFPTTLVTFTAMIIEKRYDLVLDAAAVGFLVGATVILKEPVQKLWKNSKDITKRESANRKGSKPTQSRRNSGHTKIGSNKAVNYKNPEP